MKVYSGQHDTKKVTTYYIDRGRIKIKIYFKKKG